MNEVLGKMSIEYAEEVVEQLGEAGMLDMRQGVIDGTTEEGKEQLRQIHDSGGKADGDETLAKRVDEVEVADPD